jgi:hypothetical protein
MTETETRPTAACRHCGRPIEKITAGWVDGAGFAVCVKAPAESVGHGTAANFALHEPMPAGLRGGLAT